MMKGISQSLPKKQTQRGLPCELSKVLTAVTIVALFFLVASPEATSLAQGGDMYPQAQGELGGDYRGVRAYLERANPQIRDGGWSAVRVAVARNMITFVSFGEIGWIKKSNGTCRVYVSYKTSTGTPGYNEYNTLTCGGGSNEYMIRFYQYAWRFYFDGYRKVDVALGWHQTSEVGSGGEVSSSANAMGVSGCLNNKYRNVAGEWKLFEWHFADVDPPYHLIDLSPYSWQVYGHN